MKDKKFQANIKTERGDKGSVQIGENFDFQVQNANGNLEAGFGFTNEGKNFQAHAKKGKTNVSVHKEKDGFGANVELNGSKVSVHKEEDSFTASVKHKGSEASMHKREDSFTASVKHKGSETSVHKGKDSFTASVKNGGSEASVECEKDNGKNAPDMSKQLLREFKKNQQRLIQPFNRELQEQGSLMV